MKQQKADEKPASKQPRTSRNALLVPTASLGPSESHLVGSASSYSVASAFSEYNVPSSKDQGGGGGADANMGGGSNAPGSHQSPNPNAKLASRSWAKHLPWLPVGYGCSLWRIFSSS